MNQTNTDSEWVYVVLHSESLHFQILDEEEEEPHKLRWVAILLKVLIFGSKVYALM